MSATPLLNEQVEVDTFEYEFVLRQSGRHFLLAGVDELLLPKVLTQLGWLRLVAPPYVDTVGLCKDMVTNPSSYSLGVVWARVDAYGQSLRTMAFYGEDLAEAGLFKQLLPGLTPFRVHLRDPRNGVEVLSIGSKGELAFQFRNANSLREIDKCLRHLNNRALLSWPESDPDVVGG